MSLWAYFCVDIPLLDSDIYVEQICNEICKTYRGRWTEINIVIPRDIIIGKQRDTEKY